MANDLMNQNPILKQVQALRVRVAQQAAANKVRADTLKAEEARARQGIEPTTGPESLSRNMKRVLPSYLMPGNIGDVNRVIWPFYFTATTQELPAAVGGTASQGTGTITVTQEAAFVVMQLSKVVFRRVAGPPVEYEYVDPTDSNATNTPGLSMVIQDSQSRRVFMNNPIDFEHIGGPEFPWELPTPILFLPNSTIQLQYFNSNAAETYVPWVTLFGYRVRMEDASQILSLVHQ